MPSIELDGHSDARFVLKDGKIVRAEPATELARTPSTPENLEIAALRRGRFD